MSQNPESLRPQLIQAEKALSDALDEACSSDLKAANTGELIRLEEVLAIANEAAKEAISVRRRIGVDERTQGATAVAAAPSATRSAAGGQAAREIEDEHGVRWMAFAVYPSRSGSKSSPLPDSFQRGWLAFDSGMETRRLTPIPPGWNDLTTQELRQLCDQAEAAPRRSAPRGHPEQSS